MHAKAEPDFPPFFLLVRFTPEQALQHEWARSQAAVPQAPGQTAAPMPFFDAPKPPVQKAAGGGNGAVSARGEVAQASKGLQMQQPQQPVKSYLNLAFRDRHLFPPLELGNKFLAQQPPAKVLDTTPRE
jgi:hypothetical protein